MKYNKIILFGLLLLSLLIPFVSIAYAAETPSFVGIKEGQTYVWTTEFDSGPWEDFYEDTGYTDEVFIEEMAIDNLEAEEWEEEVTEWKLTIHHISGEKETNITEPWLPSSIFDDYKYVTFIYTLKEYDGDVGWWRKIESYDTGEIWESDEKLWAYRFFNIMKGFRFSSDRVDVDEHIFPALIVPKDLDWDQLAREWLDINEIKYSRRQEYFWVDEIEIQYFLGDKHVGIKTEYDPVYSFPEYEKELDTFETISKYNDDGILYYYEFTYDGDIIAKIELKGIFGPYFIENWWWMALIAGAVVVGVIIVIVVIIKKRK